MLTATAGLLGLLSIILGFFFVFAAFVDTKPTPVNSRRRLSALLGLLCIAVGANFVAVFYTGGLMSYLRHGGAQWIVTVALYGRTAAAILALLIIFDSLGVWGRKRPR